MAAEKTNVRVPSSRNVQRNCRNVGMIEEVRGSECGGGACEAAASGVAAFSFW